MTYIGDYRVIKKIGRGGMGEVFLVKDPYFDRYLALKKIRSELCQKKSLKKRFLREAKIAARLIHPGVISVYSIHDVDQDVYYTMPYLDGQSLKDILKAVWEKKVISHKLKKQTSVSSFISIFYSICQTIEYVHSKGVLHRDIKPDNIFVGKFGEVVILDWGVALDISVEEDKFIQDIDYLEVSEEEVTIPGKLVGTLDYMAPERLLGAPATEQTDIYSLGVMLYQMLTLSFPFPRREKHSFRKKISSEKFIAPEEIAPFRDIPPLLSKIVEKCIAKDINERYSSVTSLLKDLSLHIDGNPEWFLKEKLSLLNKNHWLFQENILLSNHVPLMETLDLTEWFCIMVTKTIFSEDIALEVTLRFSDIMKGFGFLLTPPKEHQQEELLDGYCLWMSFNQGEPVFKLFKNAIEVISSYGLSLLISDFHTIRIEKRNNKLTLFVDGSSVLTYVDYLPERGSHVGIVFKDVEFFNNELAVYESSRSLYVSCLAIPNAFLADKNYEKAFIFYKQIVSSFPGRLEGREAQFRAGLTLLEEAKRITDVKEKENLYSLAFEEFSLLHKTLGAPLEYLGKSLIYQNQKDFKEEVKCLELGLRRYKEHALVDYLKEQILYRMYETIYKHKETAFALMLIVLRLLPEDTVSQKFQKFCKYIFKKDLFLEVLDLFPNFDYLGVEIIENYKISIFLSFNLASLRVLLEIFCILLKNAYMHLGLIKDVIFLIYRLGAYENGIECINKLRETLFNSSFLIEKNDFQEVFDYLNIIDELVHCRYSSLESLFFSLKCNLNNKIKLFHFISEVLLQFHQEDLLIRIIDRFSLELSGFQYTSILKPKKIWALLQLKQYSQAQILLFEYPIKELIEDSSIIFTLFGCWLAATEEKELALIHFSGISEELTIPSYLLMAYMLSQDTPFSIEKLFLWEKRILYQQLVLFYSCLGNKQKEKYYRNLLKKQVVKSLFSNSF